MNRLARLWDQLTLAPAGDRRHLVRHYFTTLAALDRGLALALLATGRLPGQGRLAKAAIKTLIEARTDPLLWQLSADHVGDFNETVALLWPLDQAAGEGPTLAEVAAVLTGPRTAIAAGLAELLDRLAPAGRHLALRIAGGRLTGVIDSQSIIDLLSEIGQQPGHAVAEAWHAAEPPYEALLGWLMAGAKRPSAPERLAFRPLSPWTPFAAAAGDALEPEDYAAAPAWDGLRVALAGDRRRLRIFDETGKDISARCPGLASATGVDGVFDGVLLAASGDHDHGYPDLSARPGTKSLNKDNTLVIICYDVLFVGERDLRDRPFEARRRSLEQLFADGMADGLALAPPIPFDDWATLDLLRRSNEAGRDGVLLRPRAGGYRAPGATHCWHWRRPALIERGLVLYAERDGAGDLGLTIGLMGADDFLAVGRIIVAGKHADLAALGAWIDANVVDRFGPVRQMKQGLVVRFSYRGFKAARRRKAGVELREAEFVDVRWDDTIDQVARLQDLVD